MAKKLKLKLNEAQPAKVGTIMGPAIYKKIFLNSRKHPDLRKLEIKFR